MARFRTVEMYPPTGFPDRLWDPQSPSLTVDHASLILTLRDAFLRSGRPVVELYSEAIAGSEAVGRRASLTITPTVALEDETAHVDVWSAEPREIPSERAFVTLCPAVGSLDALGRARLALDVVHQAVVLLAGVRGWDTVPFEAARTHVIDRAFQHVWTTPWKSSPDRRHQARAVYRLGVEDGFGRARVEVRSRGHEEALVTSEPALAFCTSAGFRRSAATLTWAGRDLVTLRPYCGLGGGSGLVEVRHHHGSWHASTRDDEVVRVPGEGLHEDPTTRVPPVVGTVS